METDYYYNLRAHDGVVETFDEISRCYAEHMHYEIQCGNWKYPSISSWIDECVNGYARGMAHIAYFATYDLEKKDLADNTTYRNPHDVPFDGVHTTIVAVDDRDVAMWKPGLSSEIILPSGREVYILDETIYGCNSKKQKED